MAEYQADIVIYGGGIAGLWTLHVLRQRGYDALLLEKDALGGGQTLASQGIIHSGLKYMLNGRISDLAKRISAMPDTWLNHLKSDLSSAKINATSQHMLMPKGLTGGVVKAIAKNLLGTSASEQPIPGELSDAGFDGSAFMLNEPVIDVPSVVRALGEIHQGCIRKTGHSVKARCYIYTAAEGNERPTVKIQRRPLLMGMMKNPPFPLFAHFVGVSEKPLATITTHRMINGDLVWYIGGQAAEMEKTDDEQKLFRHIKDAFKRYLPAIDLNSYMWSSLPIDRIEADTSGGGMPDMPIIQESGNSLYCWPTKLAFAPLLADMITQKLQEKDIKPSGKQTNWGLMPPVDYALPPWDKARWKKLS